MNYRHGQFSTPAAGILILFAVLSILSPALAATQEAPHDPETACAKLQALKLPDVSSIASQRVVAGKFQPPSAIEPLSPQKVAGLPPFCRVRIVAQPAPRSSIQVELWLPESGWNGKLLGTGTGGGAGAVNYDSLGPGIRRGFAAANTDLGTAPSANLQIDLPDKWTDFGYRATHEMTVLSKLVIAAFYGAPVQHSYFVGCSTGGQQALSEAQRYPTDYNGIIAGAPANNRTHLHSEFLWHYQATHKAGDRSLLPPEALTQITASVVSSCAGKDGGAPSDNFLTDPRACNFDVDKLVQCSATVVSQCLTQEQLQALRTIYEGPLNPATGERIYAPMPFGSEASPGGISLQESWPAVLDLLYPFQWALGSKFNPATFDFDNDESPLDDRLASIVNANNPNLEPFEKSGGKLIMYTGTADALVPFPDAIDYYENVVAFMQQHPLPGLASDPLTATQEFFRYYLVPGMAHCGSGPGIVGIGQGISSEPDDLLESLQRWTEHHAAPDEIEGVGETDRANGETLRRKICPYPRFPTYIGGNPREESSFRCKPRPRGDVPIPAARYQR